MFLNHENGRFTKNTFVNPQSYFCLGFHSFLQCVEEDTPASILIEEVSEDTLKNESVLAEFSQDTVESVINAIMYG